MSAFGLGSKKRPAFRISCTAKAIVHGTLDEISKKRATLLVYDFTFFSYRSTRIKEADISFTFEPKKGSTGGGGPTVEKVAPFAKHIMMQTSQTETRKISANGAVSGGVGATVNANAGVEKSVEKTTTHAAEIVGIGPSMITGITSWPSGP